MALTKVDQTMVSDQVFGRRRLNINGDMRVNQRGTKTSMQSGYGGPDRMNLNSGLLGVYTLSQSSESPNGFAKSFQVSTTTANTSPSSSAYAILQYRFEGNDLSSLKWGTSDAEQVTVSFWVKTNKTGTYNLELYQLDNSSNYFANKQYTVSASDTWEKKVITFPAGNNVAIPLDNTNALNVNFWLAGGSTYTGGSASDGNFHSTDADRAAGNVNLADSTSNTFRLTGLQVEIGNNATPFEHLTFGEELQICKRYFERLNYANISVVTIGQAFNSGQSAFSVLTWTVEKRGTPSITLSGSGQSDGTFSFLTSGGGYPSTTGTNVGNNINTHQCRINATGYSGLTNESVAGLYSTGASFIDIDAEI